MSAIGNRKPGLRLGIGVSAVWLLIAGCWSLAASEARASGSEWSLFEDHPTLVRSGPIVRDRTLETIKALGADTLRVEVKWAEVAPRPGAKKKPKFKATDPGAYPGFQPYDDLVVRALGKGFRVMLTLAPDAPRWATAGGRGRNYKISGTEFASFARAVAATRAPTADCRPSTTGRSGTSRTTSSS
jgi:hypothetical protein